MVSLKLEKDELDLYWIKLLTVFYALHLKYARYEKHFSVFSFFSSFTKSKHHIKMFSGPPIQSIIKKYCFHCL